jgi:hypothetical protein
MATPEIFPTCYHMDHRTIPIGATCRFCKSPPYRDAAEDRNAPCQRYNAVVASAKYSVPGHDLLGTIPGSNALRAPLRYTLIPLFPPIATTNDRREISDVTTHSEHEEQDGRERHAATADVTTRSEHEEQNERERPAATANHRRGISDVMPRSEREEQHEQARPAARRGGKRVGASELEGLGIGGGEEAKGISEGRVTRTRKIRAPRAPGDELQ